MDVLLPELVDVVVAMLDNNTRYVMKFVCHDHYRRFRGVGLEQREAWLDECNNVGLFRLFGHRYTPNIAHFIETGTVAGYVYAIEKEPLSRYRIDLVSLVPYVEKDAAKYELGLSTLHELGCCAATLLLHRIRPLDDDVVAHALDDSFFSYELVAYHVGPLRSSTLLAYTCLCIRRSAIPFLLEQYWRDLQQRDDFWNQLNARLDDMDPRYRRRAVELLKHVACE
jgi:hypothetical protein